MSSCMSFLMSSNYSKHSKCTCFCDMWIDLVLCYGWKWQALRHTEPSLCWPFMWKMQRFIYHSTITTIKNQLGFLWCLYDMRLMVNVRLNRSHHHFTLSIGLFKRNRLTPRWYRYPLMWRSCLQRNEMKSMRFFISNFWGMMRTQSNCARSHTHKHTYAQFQLIQSKLGIQSVVLIKSTSLRQSLISRK